MTEVKYTTSASVGELLDYTVDTTKLTYSYTITDSAWGLKGQSGSGTLTKNSDGTYTPSESSNTRLIIGDGILVGAIRQVVNNVTYDIPIYGVSSVVSKLEELAGSYNYISRTCSAIDTCVATYGSFKINSDGTWSSCVAGNIAITPSTCTDTSSGTLSSLGAGKFQLGGINATVFVATVKTSKVMVVDYYEPGKGQFLLGINQSSLGSNTGDGAWFTYSPTDDTAIKMTVSGNKATTKASDSYSFGSNTITSDTEVTITRNSPWNGMVQTSTGIGVVDENGALYGFVSPSNNSYLEFGVRMKQN